MNTEESLRRLIEERTQDMSLYKLATDADVEYASLHKWLNKKQNSLKWSTVSKLLDFLQVELSPQNPTMRRVAPHSPTEIVKGDALPQIPVMGSTGAGNAVELFSSVPERWIPILPQYLRHDMIGLVVDGDSMEPTIHKGAIVGVVPYDGSIYDGGIYLVQRPPFGRTIKRIKMEEEEHLVLYSDNPAYKPMLISFEGYEKIILGKIVWVWQIL